MKCPYIDFARYRIVYDEDGDYLRLSPCELTILRELTKRPGQVVTFEHLLNELYAGTRDGGPRSPVLKVLVSRIRRVIPWSITNVYGEGYAIQDYPREIRMTILAPTFTQDADGKWRSNESLSAAGHVWTFDTRQEHGNYAVLKDGAPAGFAATRLELDQEGVLWREWHGGYSWDPKTGKVGLPSKYYRNPVR